MRNFMTNRVFDPVAWAIGIELDDEPAPGAGTRRASTTSSLGRTLIPAKLAS